MNYERLEIIYQLAICACDPITFASNQKKLLEALSEYILERDKPKEEGIE